MYVALGQYQEDYFILFLKPLAIDSFGCTLAINETVGKKIHGDCIPNVSFLPWEKDSWIQRKTWHQKHEEKYLQEFSVQ